MFPILHRIMRRHRGVHGHVGEILSVAVERVAYALHGWRGVEVALDSPTQRCLVPIESSINETHALESAAMGTRDVDRDRDQPLPLALAPARRSFLSGAHECGPRSDRWCDFGDGSHAAS